MTDRWRQACPACGSRTVVRRIRKSGYRCNQCGATGFAPVDLTQTDALVPGED